MFHAVRLPYVSYVFPRNVQHIAASKGAFAGIRADGKVVAWGGSGYGGDSSNLDDTSQ